MMTVRLASGLAEPSSSFNEILAASSLVQFVFHQTAVESAIVEFDFSGCFKAYFFRKFRIASKNVAFIPFARLLHEVAYFLIGIFQFGMYSQPFTVLRIENYYSFFLRNVRVFKITSLKLNECIYSGSFGIVNRNFDSLR